MIKTTLTSAFAAFFLFSATATPAFAFHVRVVEGDATISKIGKTITITDTGSTPLILKGKLNIPVGTTVDIVGADVLLRSATHHTTSILGDLFSNGDVVIVNPYGVYLGASANINVAGLMVSTLNISNQSFIDGTYQFTKVQGLNPAEVLNAANITTAPGGYVVLLADRVVNKGTITAYMGSVALGSGAQATVSFDQSGLVNLVIDQGLAQQMTDSKGNLKAQIVNKGTITANGGKVELSAQLLQTALNNTVNNTGKIVANSVVNNGGQLELVSSGGINNSGSINAANLNEQGETFGSSGLMDVGQGFFTNLDGAINLSGGIAGNYQDTGNIVFTGNISLGNGTSLQADSTGAASGGEIIMNGHSITGNNQGLNLYASQSSDGYNDTLDGNISGVAQLGFYSSSSHNETFTSTGTTFSVDTVYTNGNALLSRTVGDGSSGNPYMIYSDSNAIGGLEYINTNATTLGYYYELANNINASDTNSGAGFTPVGNNSAPFTGNFNGNSKTISSLYINNPSADNQGLFGYISGATISSLNLSGDNITGLNGVGDLVGYSASGTLTGDTTNGTVSGNNDVGDLAGHATSSTVSSSDTTGSVTGTGDIAGGLIGYNSGGTISSSYTTGTVNGYDYVGGLIGYNSGGTISGSHVFGNITATASSSYVGGLVGENASGGTIETSYVGNNNNNTNTVSGKAYTGGLVGYNSSSTVETSFTSVFAAVNGSSYVGGLIGQNNAGTVNTDYNFADVTATGDYAGGVAGYNAAAGIIENTFSLGTVSGADDTGGLVGYNTDSTIESSYATGTAASSGTDAGGLIGFNGASSTVENSFAIGVASATSDAGGLIGEDNGSNTNTNDWWYNSTNTYGIASTSATGNKAGAETDFLSSSQMVYSSGWDISASQSHIWAMSGNHDALPLLQFRYSTSVTDTYQLQLMFLGLSDTYTIENEIFAAESQGWNEGLGFEPIGSSGTPFTGTLSGGGNEIDDFQIDRPLASDVGLFSYTDGANIHDIDLYNSSITGGNETGGLVGQDTAGSTVSSNYFQDVTVSGGNYTGGIEGEADSGGTLDSNTYKSVSVSGTDDVGGILGAGTSMTVNSNNFSNDDDDDVDVSGTSYVGGMVGDCSSCTVSSDEAEYGEAHGSSSYVGGIVGYEALGTLNDDEVDYDFPVSGGDYTGGIAGYNTGTLSNSGVGGSVSGGNYTGGVAGYNTGSMSDDFSNFSFDSGGVRRSVSGSSYVGGIAGYTSGNIENSEVSYGSVIGNSSDNYTGGVAGYATGATLYQDYADAPVSGGTDTGGLVGDNVHGIISQDYAIGSVSGSDQVGGLVGENESGSSIANSSALGNVTATGNNAGGLVGENSASTIENSSAVGTVSAVNNAGGLVGDNVSTSTVEDSFATGTATSTGDSNVTAGGLIGTDDTSNTNTNDWWYNATDTYGIASTSTTGNKAASASVFLNPDQSVYSSWNIVTTQNTSDVWAMSPDNDVLPLLQFAYTTDVEDLYQLQMMFLNLGTTYDLEENIPASVSPNWNAYQGFVPIGGSSAFTGTFNGQNLTISNLTIDPSVLTNYVGLFGQTNGANINRLTLSDVSVTGAEYVGAMAGDLISGTINNDETTNSSSSVSGSSNDVGGLVGYSSGSTLENSSSAGTVGGAAQVGGVVGYNTGGSISNDSSSSNVTGSGNNVGGLAGENNNSAISSSSASGTVKSTTGTNVGGLVGNNLNANSTIGSSNATGNVTGATMVGGLVGYNEANITSSYAEGLADGTANDVGGLVGYNSSATINDSYATGGATGVSYVGGLLGYNSGTVNNGSYASGTLTSSGSYAGGLIGENNEGDIDSDHSGTNLTVTGSGSYAGGFIGYNTGSSINSSYATGTVAAGSVTYVGGLIGFNTGTSPIQFSYATGDVTASGSDSGGLIGENNGDQIIYSYAQGDVTSSGNKVGGFIGYNLGASSIEIDHAIGDVTDSSGTDVGGFIGNNASTDAVMVDYATGNVTGGTNVGGYVGNNNGTGGLSYGYANGTVGGGSIVGGLVGLNTSSSISNAYAAGNVTDSGTIAGGLIGENSAGTITNTYADGTVSGTAQVGGLIGYNLSSSSLINSFATGVSTSSGDTAGGLVGQDDNSNTFSNDWWYNATNANALGNSPSDASLSSEVSKATAVTDFYSTSQAVYNGTSSPWDFIGIWKTTATYPELFFQYYNTWTNFEGNNNWNQAANWMNDVVPDSSTNVLFNFFNTDNSSNNSTSQLSSLVIDAAYTGTLSEDTGLTDTGVFNQYGGTYNANGQPTTVDGLTTLAGGTYEASGNTQNFSGGLTISGGTFTGNSGTINATNVTLSSGTLTAPSAPFNVSGAWDVTGGTFTPGGNTVNFDTSTAGETITTGGQGFSYVDFEPSGSGSYTLESALTAANDLTITRGTLNANDKAINVGGNWDNAGTFTPDGDTVTFTSTSTGQTITSDGSDFYNVAFNGTGGAWTLQDALTATNNLSISAGTLDTNSGNNYAITVGGNWTQTGGGFTPEDSTVTFNGTGTEEFNSNGASFYAITHSGTGTLQLTGSGLTVTHNLTNSAGIFDLNGENWTMTGANFSNNNGTVKAQGGETLTGLTMDGTHGSVIYDGTGTYTSLALGNTYNDLTFDGSGNWTLNNALTINKNLTITEGTLNANDKAISVGGSWDNAGTFTADGDTVTFTSTSSGQTLTSGGDNFYNVGFNGTGGAWTLEDALTVDNNFIVTAGSFIPGTNNVTFDGSGTQQLNSGGSSFYGITHSGTGTLQLTGSGLTVTHNLTNSSGTFDLNGENWTMTGASFSNNNGTVKAQGGETVTGLTMDSVHGNVIYDGTGTYTSLPLGNAYNNLTFNGTGSWGLLGALTIGNDLTITNGTFNGNDKDITITGNWDNAGGAFVADGDTVTFDGSAQTISGNTTFANLTDIASGTSILTFQAGSTQVLTGDMMFKGAGLSLLSSSPGSSWFIDPQGLRTIEAFRVQDSDNIDALGINTDGFGIVNLGNDINWFFPTGFNFPTEITQQGSSSSSNSSTNTQIQTAGNTNYGGMTNTDDGQYVFLGSSNNSTPVVSTPNSNVNQGFVNSQGNTQGVSWLNSVNSFIQSNWSIHMADQAVQGPDGIMGLLSGSSTDK